MHEATGSNPSTAETGSVVSIFLSPRLVVARNQRFRVILDYVVSLKPAWTTKDPV